MGSQIRTQNQRLLMKEISERKGKGMENLDLSTIEQWILSCSLYMRRVYLTG